MTALTDERTLTITFSATLNASTALVCFDFSDHITYKVNRNGARYEEHAMMGNTMVHRSPEDDCQSRLICLEAIARFARATLGVVFHLQKKHTSRYIFVSTNTIVEVVSASEPQSRIIAKQRRRIA